METIAVSARQAAITLAATSNVERNKLLECFKSVLEQQQEAIFSANLKDIEDAEKSESKELTSSVVKRLKFSKAKFQSCLDGIDQLVKKTDPLGVCTLGTELAEGLKLYRVTCPIGVLAVIYEARPEVGIQIASLAIKTGNAVILKGGKEAKNTNHAIFQALRSALQKSTVPEDVIQMVDTRGEVTDLLKLDELIDLVIPRGSKELVKHIKATTRIPVLGHADGLCSVYVDSEVDVDQAVQVIVDGKTNYPAACNALETLLVHKEAMEIFLPTLGDALREVNVKIRASEDCLAFLPSDICTLATEEDFSTEFLDLIIAIKSVNSVEEAVGHINSKGSHHTDVVITKNGETARKFMNSVDSAGVFHNCSSRFADGFRFGFGAEVGISTNKIHSRGPVGLEGLLIYKYKLFGHGNTVAEIESGSKVLTHVPLDISSSPFH